MRDGLVHIYTGDGKGKSTALAGLCARAAGAGLRVILLRFMKTDDSSEVTPLRAIGVEVVSAQREPVFTFDADASPRTRTENEACFARARLAVLDGDYDLVALDEALTAADIGVIDAQALRELVEHRPAHVELALSGRTSDESLFALADYVSVIEARKHPFARGIQAREGIEY